LTDAFDPRTTLLRPDLADAALEGLAPARAYRPLRPMQCVVAVAPLRKGPSRDAGQLDQLIFGEAFDVLEEADGFAWGRARRDGHVGYVELSDLTAPVLAPTHRISSLSAAARAAPDATAAVAGQYGLNALVAIEAREGDWLKAARAGWFAAGDLAALDLFERDPAAVAERFVGTPWQDGGRQSRGLDGSGLVQQALYACGRGCPRDADMQAAEVGREIAPDALTRGDLVFWDRHAAIMLDDARLVHADAHHRAVTVEPLAAAMARVGAPVACRRP